MIAGAVIALALGLVGYVRDHDPSVWVRVYLVVMTVYLVGTAIYLDRTRGRSR